MANVVQYGFVNLKDQFFRRISEVEEEVAAAIALTLEEHNRIVNEFVEFFAEPTEVIQSSFDMLANGRLQPVDEYGRPKPIKTSKYTVANPIRMGAVATGATWLAAAKMTVRDANNLTASALLHDINWMRSQVLAALFANTSYTFADADAGDITIYGLANADTVKYARQNAESLDTDTHYLAQAAAIDDSNNPFQTIADELTEHPENNGDVVVFIPTNLKDDVRALTNFVDVVDPSIQPGVGQSVLTGTLGVTHPGTLIGKCDDCWIIEWKALPDNYMIGTTTGGEAALRMREEPEPQLKGLILIDPEGRDNLPLIKRSWYRRCGFGAFNRVRAVVYRVGNGAYAVPTGYAQQLG